MCFFINLNFPKIFTIQTNYFLNNQCFINVFVKLKQLLLNKQIIYFFINPINLNVRLCQCNYFSINILVFKKLNFLFIFPIPFIYQNLVLLIQLNLIVSVDTCVSNQF